MEKRNYCAVSGGQMSRCQLQLSGLGLGGGVLPHPLTGQCSPSLAPGQTPSCGLLAFPSHPLSLPPHPLPGMSLDYLHRWKPCPFRPDMWAPSTQNPGEPGLVFAQGQGPPSKQARLWIQHEVVAHRNQRAQGNSEKCF